MELYKMYLFELVNLAQKPSFPRSFHLSLLLDRQCVANGKPTKSDKHCSIYAHLKFNQNSTIIANNPSYKSQYTLIITNI